MFIEDRPAWSNETCALCVLPPFDCLLLLLLLLEILFGHEPKPYRFASPMPLQLTLSVYLRFESLPLLLGSISLSHCLHSLSLRRRSPCCRIPARRSEESGLQSRWQSVGMLSLPCHSEISGENARPWPQWPTDKGGLGLKSFAFIDPLTALSGPAKA